MDVMEQTLDNVLSAYVRLQDECAVAHRAARRNRRAFTFVSVIAGVLAVALWAALMIGRF